MRAQGRTAASAPENPSGEEPDDSQLLASALFADFPVDGSSSLLYPGLLLVDWFLLLQLQSSSGGGCKRLC